MTFGGRSPRFDPFGSDRLMFSFLPEAGSWVALVPVRAGEFVYVWRTRPKVGGCGRDGVSYLRLGFVLFDRLRLGSCFGKVGRGPVACVGKITLVILYVWSRTAFSWIFWSLSIKLNMGIRNILFLNVASFWKYQNFACCLSSDLRDLKVIPRLTWLGKLLSRRNTHVFK